MPLRDAKVPLDVCGRSAGTPALSAEREVLMLADLAALTPPLLVAVAFLIAAGAFIRHEMRRGDSRAEHAESRDSWPDSAGPAERNETDQRPASRSRSEGNGDDDRDRDP